MAYYLVRAYLSDQNVRELQTRLEQEEFLGLQPFGKSLTKGLSGMRRLPDGRVAWEEEDYCTPPLRMEREAVLDAYFTDLQVERMQADEGWAQLAELPLVFADLGAKQR